MRADPLTKKIASPYARALFDFSIDQNIMHQVTADFQNLEVFLNESSELSNYLSNPIVSQVAKRDILTKTLQSQINTETFKFLMILVTRDRINLLESIVTNYLELVYETASIKTVKVISASEFSISQENTLIKKLKELTDAREIRLDVKIDPSLIGGFLIKTESKVIDFSIKNQLENLARYLDTILEI
jgi:F-type H+-transporting ATPase subunit delta